MPETSNFFSPPGSVDALLSRARALSGRTLGDIARDVEIELPKTLRRKKGAVGELMERALGAPRSSRPEPDFLTLGVELKTLPVTAAGRVLESTYVCRLDLRGLADETWETSRLWTKLRHVLFVPIEGEQQLPVPARRVGRAFLWTPSDDEEDALRRDWSDAQQLVARGLFEGLNARRGRVLQVRPKARDATVRGLAIDDDGEQVRFAPRGFYLRPTFTQGLLARALGR